MWTQHGGSGYAGLTRADILTMDWDEIDWHVERVNERRKAEAKALEDAHKKKG